jgi:hypothetical protein
MVDPACRHGTPIPIPAGLRHALSGSARRALRSGWSAGGRPSPPAMSEVWSIAISRDGSPSAPRPAPTGRFARGAVHPPGSGSRCAGSQPGDPTGVQRACGARDRRPAPGPRPCAAHADIARKPRGGDAARARGPSPSGASPRGRGGLAGGMPIAGTALTSLPSQRVFGSDEARIAGRRTCPSPERKASCEARRFTRSRSCWRRPS